MQRPVRRRRLLRWGWVALLSLAVLVAYGPSLSYGLIWDDPNWYRQGAGQTVLQLFTALPTYQFYRPLTILINRQLLSPAGVVNGLLAHALQVGAHLGVVLLSGPVLRVLGLKPWPARLAALGMAIFPLSFQAVAWQAPQGPLVMLGVLLSLWLAHYYQRGYQPIYLLLSLGAYAAALLIQEVAVALVVLFFWLALQTPSRRWRARAWPLGHAALAGVYLLIWRSVPRLGGVTGAGFQPSVLAYLLQALVFPIARITVAWTLGWPVALLLAGFALTGAVLLAGVWRGSGARAALVCSLWVVAGALPIWVGLSWDYVQVGERLLYPASLGIAAAWASWAAWTFTAVRLKQRLLGAGILALTVGVSVQHLWLFQRLYATGTGHLTQAVTALAAEPQARFLFVNFPDRFETRPAYYPLGFWGLTLAPPVQALADYARAETGSAGEDRSLAAFPTGASDRAAWPYRVDLRGVNSAAATLLTAAEWADHVYLSHYQPDGSLQLREVGAARPAGAPGPYLADVGPTVQLLQAAASVRHDQLQIRTVWRCFAALDPAQTIFVHFWRQDQYLGDADGDSLGGLVPLATWTPGLEVTDLRWVDLAHWEAGTYDIRVGIYNRATQTRAAALSSAGQPFPENEVSIGTIQIP